MVMPRWKRRQVVQKADVPVAAAWDGTGSGARGTERWQCGPIRFITSGGVFAQLSTLSARWCGQNMMVSLNVIVAARWLTLHT